MSSVELVTLVVDDVEVQVPKGLGLVETAAVAGIEIPVFCYEPRIGPPIGACRMCLVEVEGQGKLQAGCTLTAQDGMVVRTAQTSEQAADGQNVDARVHPREPPARLPGLRQGRRVPAPGSDVPLRARQHADDVSQADLRQADPDQPADRARPRALHPLLPLHALLRRGLRGRPADRAQPRRAVRDRDLRGRAVPRAVHRQRDRALPGRRADLDAVPVRGASLGDPERPVRLRDVPGGLQHLGDDPRGEGQADPLPQPPGGRRRLALRQGQVRVRPPGGVGPCRRSAAQGRSPLRRALVGRRAGRGRGADPRRRGPDRHRAVGLGDGRARLRARKAASPGCRRAFGAAPGAGRPLLRRVHGAALDDPRRPAGRRARRRACR